ncbi:adenylate/guanylate cyclase domain-containing protein [Bradyrhizobium sp. STM 3557]|uniref:adenylate/guanylate cyclase domain-containing protein n=1 Tax=Bradyrhizobium sp. STM 3557 TaxID=578920 RepID=UPI00388D0E4E
MDVADWLKKLGLDQYAPQFCDNHITGDLLPNLTADDLRDLGINSVGHRRRLLRAIGLLRDQPSGDTLARAERSPAEQREAAPGERRQVTVLFADLTGYTALSNLLDAEEIEGILTAFFEVADAAIIEYGGTIDKHIGDCVMAVFGAPVAHDNDAERAVLAALRIRDSVPMLHERLGRDIGVHVGIASGEVLASQVGSARHKAYTVTGESVNLASRLTDHAKSGEVLLSSSVYRGLQDRLDCEDVGDIDVKGLDSPVRAWRLSGTRRAPVGNRAFVGRASELNQFAAAMATCLEIGRGRVIYLRGEAGLGKTRLVEEFQRLARRDGFTCHSGLVLDFGNGSGRDAVRAVIRSVVLGGGAEPSVDDVGRETISAVVDAGRIDADHAIFLYDLLNVPPPIELRALYDAMDIGTRSRGVWTTIRQLVASAASANTMLIVIEDLHWADDSVLAQISALAEATSDCPLLLVLTSRNIDDPLARGWQPGGPILTIDLAPLHHEEALGFARTVFGQMGPFAMRCLERAAGNPLFLEQLLRNAEEHADGAVPDSVQSLVQARMDRLAPSDKQALQAASVFGQRLSLGGLRALIEDPLYAPRMLIEHALLRPHGDEFLFGHALIRDAVYATLLRSRRRELHRRAAAWFAERDFALHAQHLDRAEDPRAPQAYLAAARSEAARYRYEQALTLIARGASLARDLQDRFALACYRGELLHDMGEVADARAAYEVALQQSQNDADRCRAWLGVAAVKRVTDDLPGALADIERAEDVATRLSLGGEAARAHFLHGNLLFPQGDLEGCLREHRSSLELAREAGSAELEAAALGGLGDAEYARGRMLSAREHFANCIELSRRHGFGRIEVANLPMFAFMRFFAGEIRAALSEALAAIEMAAKVGHRRAQTIAHHAAYHARHSLGEFSAARANVEAALQLARQLKARRFEAEALAFAAELDRLAGCRLEALAAIREALAISAETGMAYFGPIYYGIQALIEEDEARRRAALSDGEAWLAGNVVAHNHLLFRKDAIEASLLLRDWDEAERHAAALEDFVRPEPLPWTGLIIARARAFAAFGRGCRDAQLEGELLRLQIAGDQLGIRLPSLSEVIGPTSG